VLNGKMAREAANPWPRLSSGALIAPSLLASDFVRLGEQIDAVAAAGVQVLHVDIMDGHFVPNLSMGPGFVKAVRRHTDLALDVHLMLTDPATYIERFAEAGADSITFHVEATDEPGRLIGRLRELGLGAGITLRPGTGADAVAEVAGEVDLALVMTVEPGYGGQEFMDNMLAKIAALRGMLRPAQRLEVDGGISPRTAAMCAAHGADVFVAGTDVFGSDDVGGAVRALRRAAVGGE